MTNNPLFAAAISVIVLLMGLYLKTGQQQVYVMIGWVLVLFGGLGVIVNLLLYLRSRR